MANLKALTRGLFVVAFALGFSAVSNAQRSLNAETSDTSNFGPVTQAYLGYLANEQEVVDDRNSRKEISAAYYHRNSNRIRALRTMAIRLVHQSGNDYVPELEAVAPDELRTIFERPPSTASLRPNAVLADKFRFLATVHAGEVFYVFARLDPYEQAELMKREGKSSTAKSEESGKAGPEGQRVGQTAVRPRRVVPQ
jgi:hypothetical protein